MTKLRVPATSANLGPGYDTLGLALAIYNDFEIKQRNDSQLNIKIIDKKNNKQIKIPDSDNLVALAYKKYFSFINKKLIGADIFEKMNTPLARGLGSSSSAIVGGLAAAALMSGVLVSENEFIQLAVALEKHPDNVIPALVGGLTINFYCNDSYDYYKIDVDQKLDFILAVPDYELKTENLRKVLPQKINYSQAISNLSRISLLTSAFLNKDYKLLKIAMEDQLHQPFRKKLVKAFDSLIKTAYENGAVGAALSGAGPTIIAVAEKNTKSIAEQMQTVFLKNSLTAEVKVVKACNRSLYQVLKRELA